MLPLGNTVTNPNSPLPGGPTISVCAAVLTGAAINTAKRNTLITDVKREVILEARLLDIPFLPIQAWTARLGFPFWLFVLCVLRGNLFIQSMRQLWIDSLPRFIREGKKEGAPLPLRCRNRVNSLYYTGMRLSRT